MVGSWRGAGRGGGMSQLEVVGNNLQANPASRLQHYRLAQLSLSSCLPAATAPCPLPVPIVAAGCKRIALHAL